MASQHECSDNEICAGHHNGFHLCGRGLVWPPRGEQPIVFMCRDGSVWPITDGEPNARIGGWGCSNEEVGAVWVECDPERKFNTGGQLPEYHHCYVRQPPFLNEYDPDNPYQPGQVAGQGRKATLEGDVLLTYCYPPEDPQPAYTPLPTLTPPPDCPTDIVAPSTGDTFFVGEEVTFRSQDFTMRANDLSEQEYQCSYEWRVILGECYPMAGWGPAFPTTPMSEGTLRVRMIGANGETDTVDVEVQGFTVDLDVDANRNGEVEAELDEEGEDVFGRERGAALLVNGDDDGTPDGPDNSNGIIDSGDDYQDVATMRIEISEPGLSQTYIKWYLRVPVSSAVDEQGDWRLRIFSSNTEGAGEILGPENQNLCGGYCCCEIGTLFSSPEEPLFLGVEALKHVGENGFDGSLLVELVGGSDGCPSASYSALPSDLKDRVHLQVAPLLLSTNSQKIARVYTPPNALDLPIYSDLCEIFGEENVFNTPQSIYPFRQDLAEIACHYVAQDGELMSIPTIIDLNHWDTQSEQSSTISEWPRTVAENENGYQYVLEPTAPIGGYAPGLEGGDIETTALLDASPFGVFMSGETARLGLVSPLQVDPDGQKLSLICSWLRVGHVDEVACFLPRQEGEPIEVMVPSPKAAYDILHEKFIQGEGAEWELWAGRGPSLSAPIKVKALLVERRPDEHMVWDYLVTSLTSQCNLSDSPDDRQVTLVPIVGLVGGGYVPGDLLRIDDEIMRIEEVISAGNTETVLKVKRGAIHCEGEGGHPGTDLYPVAAHSGGAQAYVLNDTVASNFRGPRGVTGLYYWYPQRSILVNCQRIRDFFGNGVVIYEMPVLFEHEEIAQDDVKYFACTTNVVNALVEPGRMIMPEPHGPEHVQTGLDLFKQDAFYQLRNSSNRPTHFIECWPLHRKMGELHCASNVVRDPMRDSSARVLPWWSCSPEEER